MFWSIWGRWPVWRRCWRCQFSSASSPAQVLSTHPGMLSGPPLSVGWPWFGSSIWTKDQPLSGLVFKSVQRSCWACLEEKTHPCWPPAWTCNPSILGLPVTCTSLCSFRNLRKDCTITIHCSTFLQDETPIKKPQIMLRTAPTSETVQIGSQNIVRGIKHLLA